MGRIGDSAAAEGRRIGLARRLSALGDRPWDGRSFLELRSTGVSAPALMSEISAGNHASQVDSSPQRCQPLPKWAPNLLQVTVCGMGVAAAQRSAMVVNWALVASTPNE